VIPILNSGGFTMTNAIRKIHTHTDTLRDVAGELANRIDHVAGEMTSASSRLGKKLERVQDALADANTSVEAPANGVARALDDLANEAKRSLDRIVRPPRPTLKTTLKTWWARLASWRP
jgi:predicted trehalose synthase